MNVTAASCAPTTFDEKIEKIYRYHNGLGTYEFLNYLDNERLVLFSRVATGDFDLPAAKLLSAISKSLA